jgi:hypothetical protein
VALDVEKGTVTIDGDKATKAGRWLKHIVASVEVDKALKSPVFIAAMRLRDVASEVASILKKVQASFELTDCEVVVYTWHRKDLKGIFSAITDVVGESQVEVYDFADNNESKQLFYSRLADWTTQYAHSVYIQVDKTNRHMYRMAGLTRYVKLLYEDLLPCQCHKIVRSVTPSQAQLLQVYGGSMFDSADDCHMTLSGDNREMVVYCTQCVEAEVIQKCANILDQRKPGNCTEPPEADSDMTAMSRLLNGIDADNRVVMQCEQSDNRVNSESKSEQMFVGPSYCVDISDNTQLRLVDADIDKCV